jgi:hypothetical protein
MPQFAGGCLCGKVRYRAEVDPAFTGICHCRNCQKQSGGVFSVGIGVPHHALIVQGQLKTFSDKGDSGKAVYRRFCPSCGSSVLTEVDAMPGVIMIAAGTLDDASWLQPSLQMYCDSAQPWVKLAAPLKRFGRMPS